MRTAQEYAIIAHEARTNVPPLETQLAIVDQAVAEAANKGYYKTTVDLPNTPHEWLLDTLREKGFVVGCKGALITISW